MQLRSSLFCLGLLVTSIACSDKGSGGDDDDTGGSSTTGGNSHAGTKNTSGTNNSTAGKTNGGSDTGGTGNSEAGTPATDGGTDGGGDKPLKSYTFDTAAEGFTVSDSSAAVAVDPIPKAEVMLSHNDADGEPDPGSLQLDIPYTAASQYVSTGVDIRPPSMRAVTDPGPDLSGKTITAWVKIDSGFGETEDLVTAPGNAKIYAKTGADYVYGSAAVANLTDIGVWVELTFELDFPGYTAETGTFDPTDVREIGIQLDTNSASTTPTAAVVLIDTISY